MANASATAISQQQLYNQGVLNGFVSILAPLRAFTTDLSPAPAEKGYTVNVSFIPSGSNAAQFVEGTGYTVQAATREARSISLSNHWFVSTALTDFEIANSSLMRIEDTAFQQGAALGKYVFQNIAAKLSGSNFAVGSNQSSSSAYTVANLIDARKLATDLNWNGQKNIIVNPTVYAALLKDTKMLYINRGDDQTVKTGVMSNVFGWDNIFESTAYPLTTQVSGSNIQVGACVDPNAVLVAMRYLQPQDDGGKQLIEAFPISDPVSGITLGYRKWYDANLGQVKSVYECVWGSAVGNANAAINLTATSNT
jgi:hypothetical protein